MKHLRLVAKILGFTVCILWVFSFLAVSIMVLPVFVDILTSHYNLTEWGPTALSAWFTFTVFVVGTFTTLIGFKFIGKWEGREVEEE